LQERGLVTIHQERTIVEVKDEKGNVCGKKVVWGKAIFKMNINYQEIEKAKKEYAEKLAEKTAKRINSQCPGSQDTGKLECPGEKDTGKKAPECPGSQDTGTQDTDNQDTNSNSSNNNSSNSNSLNINTNKSLSPISIWTLAMDKLRENLGDIWFKTWGGSMKLFNIKDGYVIIRVPNDFTKGTIEMRYKDSILKAIKDVTLMDHELKIEVKF
jgi:hypothetical protein